MSIVIQCSSNRLSSEINANDRLCGDAKFADIGETVKDLERALDVHRTWVMSKA